MSFGTVYLSGPMTGYAGHNYPAFAEAAAVLRGIGFIVTSPAESFGGRLCEEGDRPTYMKADMLAVLQVDRVVVLHGWEMSKGARTEVQVAFEAGTPVHDFETGCRIEPFDLTHTPLNEEIIRDTQQTLGGNVKQRSEASPDSTRSVGLLPRCDSSSGERESDRERAAQSRGADALGTGEVTGSCRLHSSSLTGEGDAGRRRGSALSQDRVACTCPTPTRDRAVPRTGSSERRPTFHGKPPFPRFPRRID